MIQTYYINDYFQSVELIYTTFHHQNFQNMQHFQNDFNFLNEFSAPLKKWKLKKKEAKFFDVFPENYGQKKLGSNTRILLLLSSFFINLD